MTDYQQPTYPPGPPDEASTEPPVELRRPRWSGRQKIAALVAVVALAATGVLAFALTSGKSDPATGYGHDPVTQAKRLHLCDNPERFGDSTARCTLPLGDGTVVLGTTSSETEQSFEVAMVTDQGGTCNVVAKGWIVGASSRGLLTEAVGVPEEFASKYHGYVLCG